LDRNLLGVSGTYGEADQLGLEAATRGGHGNGLVEDLAAKVDVERVETTEADVTVRLLIPRPLLLESGEGKGVKA